MSTPVHHHKEQTVTVTSTVRGARRTRIGLVHFSYAAADVFGQADELLGREVRALLAGMSKPQVRKAAVVGFDVRGWESIHGTEHELVLTVRYRGRGYRVAVPDVFEVMPWGSGRQIGEVLALLSNVFTGKLGPNDVQHIRYRAGKNGVAMVDAGGMLGNVSTNVRANELEKLGMTPESFARWLEQRGAKKARR